MKYTKICLMIPTYKRTERLKEIIESVYNTCSSLSTICFSFCVNVNDEETKKYLNDYKWHDKNCFEIIDEKTMQPNLSLYFNLMYDNTKFKDAIVTMIGDDMVFVTKNWDLQILKKINEEDGKVIVYCDDDYIAHEKCCVNMFTTREIVEATEKPFMCSMFHADMIDVIWTLVGTMSNTLFYMKNIIIKHNHSTKLHESCWDETFRRLSPVQKIANSNDNRKLGIAYATLCAKNLIESGIGKWNLLQ